MVDLNAESLEWAKNSLVKFGGSDKFPKPFEFDIIEAQWEKLLPKLVKKNDYIWRGGRRFIIPVYDDSFRVVTQIDPLDDLILTSLLHQYGQQLEAIRVPVSEKIVFSNRFDADNFTLHSREYNWRAFWDESINKAKSSGVLITDISDCYNQLYHHTIENQMRIASIPDNVNRFIQKYLSTLSSTVSRGVPVGPFSSHLIAEMALQPIDQGLIDLGYSFCRYIDDYHIFCENKKESQLAIYDFVEILDDNGRLTMQQRKTKFIQQSSFEKYAAAVVSDSLLPDEEKIVNVLLKHTDGDPYATIELLELSPEEKSLFDSETICEILLKHTHEDDLDYSKIRWFLRRLSQIGVPGAVEFILENLENLLPALTDICRYLISAKKQYKGEWKDAGDILIDSLDVELVKHCEYLRLILLSTFSKNTELNHMPKLIKRYSQSSDKLKREIVLFAIEANSSSWVRGKKDEILSSESWLKRSLIKSMGVLPKEEREHFLRSIKRDPRIDMLDESIIDWIFNLS